MTKKLLRNKKNEILDIFEILIKYLKLAKQNLKNNPRKISEELEKWKEEITFQEIEEGINLILKTSKKWLNLYKNTNDILKISLKEYDTISKESAYILGECALIKDLYFEIIDFQIGCIGAIMCEEIKKGGIGNE